MRKVTVQSCSGGDEHEPEKLLFDDEEELMKLIDEFLLSEDLNNDGYVDWTEYQHSVQKSAAVDLDMYEEEIMKEFEKSDADDSEEHGGDVEEDKNVERKDEKVTERDNETDYKEKDKNDLENNKDEDDKEARKRAYDDDRLAEIGTL